MRKRKWSYDPSTLWKVVELDELASAIYALWQLPKPSGKSKRETRQWYSAKSTLYYILKSNGLEIPAKWKSKDPRMNRGKWDNAIPPAEPELKKYYKRKIQFAKRNIDEAPKAENVYNEMVKGA